MSHLVYIFQIGIIWSVLTSFWKIQILAGYRREKEKGKVTKIVSIPLPGFDMPEPNVLLWITLTPQVWVGLSHISSIYAPSPCHGLLYLWIYIFAYVQISFGFRSEHIYGWLGSLMSHLSQSLLHPSLDMVVHRLHGSLRTDAPLLRVCSGIRAFSARARSMWWGDESFRKNRPLE